MRDIELVFSADEVELLYDNNLNHFILNLSHDQITLNLCALIVLKRKIDAIDIVSILSDQSMPDVELIYLPHCERIIVLDIKQILRLKELLVGTFVMLELNSIIHSELIRPHIF